MTKRARRPASRAALQRRFAEVARIAISAGVSLREAALECGIAPKELAIKPQKEIARSRTMLIAATLDYPNAYSIWMAGRLERTNEVEGRAEGALYELMREPLRNAEELGLKPLLFLEQEVRNSVDRGMALIRWRRAWKAHRQSTDSMVYVEPTWRKEAFGTQDKRISRRGYREIQNRFAVRFGKVVIKRDFTEKEAEAISFGYWAYHHGHVRKYA